MQVPYKVNDTMSRSDSVEIRLYTAIVNYGSSIFPTTSAQKLIDRQGRGYGGVAPPTD